MEDNYYIGFYFNHNFDDYDYTNCKTISLDKFNAFYYTTKITDKHYKITEIIKNCDYYDAEVGDIINTEDCGFSHEITRNDEKIITGRCEGIYLISKSDFYGFIDSVVESNIISLYNNIKNFNKNKIYTNETYIKLENYLEKIIE